MKQLLMIILPLVGGILLGWIIRWLYARFQLSSSEQKAVRLSQDALKEAEAKKREVILETKDQLFKEREKQERELRERRTEVQRFERRLVQREENLEKKAAVLDNDTQNLNKREEILHEKENKIEEELERWKSELERIAEMTSDEAKDIIIRSLEDEAKKDAQVIVNKIEQEAHKTAERKARDILVTTIQRIATEVSSDVTVTSVNLPSDEMKGRIIGREGRNIRTLETLTGVDIIIDDTPEAVVISCFDPVRREIARIALERLIADGRIHPARIEEVVQRISKDINQTVMEEGERVLFDIGIHNLNQEGTRALGRLHFRTSYGQNVLQHSKEVAVIAGTLAAEVGADVETAKRGALLHDIGKAIEADGDANHAELGADLARKLGESDKVINSILSHHNDVEPNCLESVLVQVADAISAARPGARRETLNNYIKRLENLERIAMDFQGVDKAFAIQAGRELRIMVKNDLVDEKTSPILAKDIAKRIENELKYPGRIKVTIIRETRVTEYAR